MKEFIKNIKELIISIFISMLKLLYKAKLYLYLWNEFISCYFHCEQGEKNAIFDKIQSMNF